MVHSSEAKHRLSRGSSVVSQRDVGKTFRLPGFLTANPDRPKRREVYWPFCVFGHRERSSRPIVMLPISVQSTNALTQ